MNVKNVFKAESLVECYEYLEKDYLIISGGTDVVVKLNEGHLDNVSLLDISSVKDLKGVTVEGPTIKIGAGSTFTEVINQADKFPKHIGAFVESLESVGSPQIRNAGTIGGNICNGSPAADSIPPLIALEATLQISSKSNSRELRIDDFFLGKGKVALNKGELLESISFEIPKQKYVLRFYKYSLRNALSITLGSIAALIELEKGLIKKINVASGGFSAYCQKESEIEKLLINTNVKDLESILPNIDKIVQKRIEMFDDEFKTMKNITLSGALRHVIKG